ncbi:MAG: hypothetical protein V1722_04975 [Candidatus Micrarchaeota archaeon]
MASAKKSKKQTTVAKQAATASAGKESDEEFLKRFMNLKETASRKATAGMGEYAKETEEGRVQGRQIGQKFEEIEQCQKIVEEFKINPPVAVSKHVNGISVEYAYEDRFKAKIEMLKKNGFGFLNAVKYTSINAPTFKTTGRAYVRRGGQRILLPASAIPPLDSGLGMGSRLLNPKDTVFILENGDIIETEDHSYVQINDIRSDDNYSREIFVYPSSEVSLVLTRNESHPTPSSMVPSKETEVILRNSSNTVINYNFVAVSLIKGIFNMKILDSGKDVNKFLKIASGYPAIEFLPTSQMIGNIIDKLTAKMPKNVVAKINATKSPRGSKVCDDISAYIELCKDGSVVTFGTPNPVKNMTNGKIAYPNLPKHAPGDFIITGKITIAGDRMYSEAADAVDPRAKAIVKNRFAVEKYISFLNTKKELEQNLKAMKEKNAKLKAPESESSKRDKERKKAELLDQQAYYKKAGDTEMVDATQIQLDELDPQKVAAKYEAMMRQARPELLDEIKRHRQAGDTMRADAAQMQLDVLEHNEEGIEAYMIKMIGWCDSEIAKLRSDLNTNFPQYNSPRETDLV